MYLKSLTKPFLAIFVIFFCINSSFSQSAPIRIAGVMDGPLTGGIPKFVELEVLSDIPDLSIYGIGSANNGGGTDGEEFSFPMVSAVAGQRIFIASESTGFFNFFGANPDYTAGAANINGDDAIELFSNGLVIDVFGDIDTDGTGEPWDHLDGWAVRTGGGPDGSTFVLGNWTFSGINALDGETTNLSATTPYPNPPMFSCVGDAGPDQIVDDNVVVQLAATADNGGQWSGGAGMFSDVNAGNSTYTPDASETGTTVTLTWTAFAGETACVETDYTVSITIIGPSAAGFSYDPAMICPSGGVAIPTIDMGATTGIFTYSVVSGGPMLDLDPLTGMIEADNSDEGEYVVTNSVTTCGNMIISAVVDGDLPQGLPKALELYALTDIADLSAYGLGTANNGATMISQDVDLPAVSLSAGDFYYISTVSDDGAGAFETFFGFAPDFSTNTIQINGDDVVGLFCRDVLFDVYGDLGFDGSGLPWEYTNGWAYSDNDRLPNQGTFDVNDWSAAEDGLEDETSNSTATLPVPIGEYTIMNPPTSNDAMENFNVSIEFDANPSIGLVCKDNVITSIDPATCTANISYLMLLSGVDPAGCFDYDVVIEGIDGNLIPNPGTYTASVVSGYDGNSCWGTITVEDKAAPIVTCPLDATIDCLIDPTPENVRLEGITIGSNPDIILDDNASESEETARDWGLSVTECSDFTLSFSDVILNNACEGDTIIRTFKVIDAGGLTSTCSQQIYLAPEDMMDIELPDDFDCISDTGCSDRFYSYGSVSRVATLECDGAGTVWNKLLNGNPSPYDKFDAAGNLEAFGTGKIGGLGCGNIQAGYTDTRISTCNGENNVPCSEDTPSFKIIRQWKILDWCTGAVVEHNQIIKVMDLEAPEFEPIDDMTIGTSLWDCSASVILPVGVASDNCSSEVSVTYGSTTGTITDGTLYLADNAKTMNGDTVNVYVNYSDCCGNISIDTFLVTVIDDVPPVPVADAHTVVSLSEYNTEGLAKIYVETFDEGSFDNCGPVGLGVRRMSGTCTGFSEEDDAGKYFDFIHFCCKDVGNTIMVEFQVCDDADMDGEFGTDGDLCNTAMIEVEVQDKLAPACSVPADRDIDCIEFAALGDLVNSGPLNSSERAQIDALFGEANGAASCKVSIAQELTSEEDCGMGEVTRIVRVTNTNNELTTTCTQTIMITADPNVNFLVCSDISFPAGSAEQKAFEAVDIDDVWCETNPKNIGDPVLEGEDLPAIEIMDCAGVNITAPVIDYDNLCSEVGIKLSLDTFDFAGGGCKKILAHWEIVDQCQFQENYVVDGEINPFVASNGYFELYVEYDLFDTVGPEITCGEGFDASCDGIGLVGTLTATATDDCTTDASFFGWNWKFDENGDGTVDAEGEGNSISPADIDTSYDAFPDGGHIVTWIVSDGCGNLSSMDCPLGFAIVDEKEPTPYCKDGLSSAVMLEDGVTLWAADFDAGSFDNCGDVFVTIVPEKDVEGLSEEEAYIASLNRVMNITTGKMEYGWNFTCDYILDGVSSTIDVRMYATDESGLYDYCVASFRLQDNLGGCPDVEIGILDIGGRIATPDDQMVSGVEVEAMTSSPEFPKYTTTDADGNYAFYNNPEAYDYEITPSKRDDYTNGVTTLDLLLIQKHLLNIEPLSDAYKMIAADVNNDSSIKVSDLLQLRKLILGLYENDVLPNNDSWRFVASEGLLSDGSQPWPFDEVGNVDNLEADMMTADFMGVKVGDVNGTVQASGLQNAQLRQANTLTLEVNEGTYQTGEAVQLSFTSADFKDVYGYQFTLEFDKGLEFTGVESGSLKLSEGNFGLNRIDEGLITTSFDDVKGSTVLTDEVLFTVTFLAKETVSIGSSVRITSKVTAAEAYVGSSLEINNVELRTKEGVSTTGFALNQNEPNPFKTSTNISFNLPEAATANLKVYDVTGKVLYMVTGDYDKGMNTIQVKGIDATGVMYYQLNAGEYTATKKMILIK